MSSVNFRAALGYNGSHILFTKQNEVAWVCGNTLVLQSVTKGQQVGKSIIENESIGQLCAHVPSFAVVQRILNGTSFGIQCFATSRHHDLIAVAERGPAPLVRIYRTSDLRDVGTLEPPVTLGFTALAFSSDGKRLAVCTDEPDLALLVYQWEQSELLVKAKLSNPADSVSFQPYNGSQLCTTGGGSLSAWRIDRLSDRLDISAAPVELPGGLEPTCHMWFPGGLYVGGNSGELVAIDKEALAPLRSQAPPPADAPQNAADDSTTVPPSSLLIVQATPSGSAVSAICVSRDHVAVVGSEPTVRWFSHAKSGRTAPSEDQSSSPPRHPFEICAEYAFGGVSAPSAMDLGGDRFGLLVLGGSDGSVRLAELDPSCMEVRPTAAPLSEAHSGTVSGLSPHPSRGGAVLSCGHDGSLRLWDLQRGAGGACLEARRTFSSAQTAIAACPRREMVAVGSESGVLRLVSLADNAVRPLQVTYRRRLHTSAIHAIAFSHDGNWMATAGQRENQICFILLRDQGSALVIGHFNAPESILSLSWPSSPIGAGEECVLLATLASGNVISVTAPLELAAAGRTSGSADMHLSGHEGVTVRTLKVETPISHAVLLRGTGVVGGGGQYGDLVGLGTDRQVHLVPLPDAHAWVGAKGKVAKSACRLSPHEAAPRACAASGTGLFVATASADGSFAAHAVSSSAASPTDLKTVFWTASPLHDAATGGAYAVTFDISGRWIVSAGSAGSMFLFEAVEGSALTGSRGPQPDLLPLSPSSIDQDAFDESSELTEAQAHQKRLAKGHVAAAAAAAAVTACIGDGGLSAAQGRSQSEVASRLDLMRAQLLECMRRNEAAEEIEKVDRVDFVIDRGLVRELKASADARVVAVRDGIRMEHLHLELVASRVKDACWEAISGQKGQSISGMKAVGSEVHNFPLIKPDERVLRKIMTLRRMEVLDRKLSQKEMDGDGALSTESSVVSAADSPRRAHVHSETSHTMGGIDPLSIQAMDGSGLDNLELFMYDDLEMHGRTRKAAQLHFYRYQVNEIKKKFNTEFEALSKLKRSEADKIMDLNAKIEETVKDLVKLGAAPLAEDRFVVSYPEDMNHIMTVRDDEVKAEKVVTEAERARREAKPAADDGASGLQGGASGQDDGKAERALKQMMGGTLVGKQAEADPYALDRPEWMEGNPKLFTEDQAREFKEFLSREKTLLEDKAKKVGMLESELRSLKANVDEVAHKYDEALQGLLSKRLKAQAEAAALESRIIALSINLEHCAAADESVEHELYHQASQLSDARGRLAAELGEKRSALADIEARVVELAGEERMLDRNFKKEFIDSEPFYSTMLQLYRSQSSLPAAAAAAAAAVRHEEFLRELVPTTMDPFPLLPASVALDPDAEFPEEPEVLPDSLCPEGLDQEWWRKLVQYRARKIRSGVEIRRLGQMAGLLSKEVARMGAEEAALAHQADAKMSMVASLLKERKEALYDAELQLRLKAGQVEAQPPGLVSSDLSAAAFVHRSSVEGLNEAIQARGTKKVEVMTAIKDFKKGIYQVEWEHKRCDMMLDDLREKTKEIQMLHVTRDFQSVFGGEGKAKRGQDKDKAANEVASLEALSKQREALHAKLVQDKQRKLRRVARSIEERQKQNADVGKHLVTLEQVLSEQDRLQQSMQSPEEANSRRMRSMVTHKRLKEIATAQQSEMSALAAELDKLRLRTYPTFMEPTLANLPPDTKASLWRK